MLPLGGLLQNTKKAQTPFAPPPPKKKKKIKPNYFGHKTVVCARLFLVSDDFFSPTSIVIALRTVSFHLSMFCVCLVFCLLNSTDHCVDMRAWTLLLNISVSLSLSLSLPALLCCDSVSYWTLAGGQAANACTDVCLSNNLTHCEALPASFSPEADIGFSWSTVIITIPFIYIALFKTSYRAFFHENEEEK